MYEHPFSQSEVLDVAYETQILINIVMFVESHKVI